MSCHDGGIATTDLRAEVRKISAHPMLETDWEHRPDEDLLTMNRHVTCGDCHAPHAIETGPARPPAVPASMRGVKGVDISGMPTAEASFEYEVCFGCHGLSEQQHTSVARVDSTTNARLEFDPVNASFHPVASPGRNTDIPGLIDGHGPASMIYCGDCHGSDEAGARGGVGGPHGSVYEPMLAREYQTLDPYPESVQGYALCYRCHDRNTLLADRGGFPHRRHVVELAASCATCHDAHGSRDNSHLINFMTRDRDGRGVVAPSGSGLLEFQDLGRFTGQCSLTCHGADHDPLVYR